MPKFDFQKKNIGADAGAGLTMAIVAIPDAVASAILAGVNPIFGFNAYMIGMPVSGLFTSSQFMNCGLTTAMMLIVAGAVAGASDSEQAGILVTLTILVGIFQLVLGFFKLGRLTRFISNAVMTGFFTGIAVSIILGQLSGLTGYESEAGNHISRTVDLLLHLDQVQWPTFLTGAATIILSAVLTRTKISNYALIAALLVVTALVALLGLSSVPLIGDSYEISGALPRLSLPDLTLIPQLILPAVSVGLIGLIQAAGVSQSIPNPDGSYPDPSGDFVGQGIGNTAAGLFQGLPVGGSLAGTALTISCGARSRWANIFAGILFALLVILVGRWVGLVAEPAIAALLILAGWATIKVSSILNVWDVGLGSRLIMIITFLATLLIPVQWAVLLGVGLSFLVEFLRSANDVRLVEVRRNENGAFIEQDAPARLSSHQVTLLQVWGTLEFSSAHILEGALPDVEDAERPAVILRMRGRNDIGSTLIGVLEHYSQRLAANGGKLFLSGVDPHMLAQLRKTRTTKVIPEENIFPATPELGESTQQALQAAQAWLEQ